MQHRRNLLIPDTLADACDPDRIALIVYDMQVGVVGQLADGPQVTARAAGARGGPRGRCEGLFHQAHDAARGADGCLPAAHRDGLAAQGSG